MQKKTTVVYERTMVMDSCKPDCLSLRDLELSHCWFPMPERSATSPSTQDANAGANVSARAGAANLLDDCLGIGAGERLLLIVEPSSERYFEPGVAALIETLAIQRGVSVSRLTVPLPRTPSDTPQAVFDAIAAADRTVFLSRLGDQLRFSSVAGKAPPIMCYALDMELLSASFGTTPWTLFRRVHDLLLGELRAASRYRLTCPAGTDLVGKVPVHGGTNDFGVLPFPTLIYPPTPALEMNGVVAFDEYLLSTSINKFDDAVVPLDQPLLARVEDCRIVGFDGAPEAVAAAESLYERVGRLGSGDSRQINSWHAGIYPHTFYAADPADDVARWGDLAFGNPRYAHFHTCGTTPGNIAGSSFDMTIEFDGVPYWSAGVPVFLERDAYQGIAKDYPDTPHPFEMRWDIALKNRR